jgi:dolichol-phosphate mannosyltransferase
MNGMVIIPTYCEHENISLLIPRILDHDLHVLVVDDNSPDGTGDVVAGIAQRTKQVHLLRRPGKQGLGTAYVAGFHRALQLGAPYIFEMDADFSHDPSYLPSLLDAARTRYDLVIGSRYVQNGGTIDWGLLRQLLSRGGNLYARIILGLPFADLTTGFRCYRRQVLETIDLDQVHSNGYAFQIEMVYRTYRCGFLIGELPIIFSNRRMGNSKMSKKIIIEALINVWRLRLNLI